MYICNWREGDVFLGCVKVEMGYLLSFLLQN